MNKDNLLIDQLHNEQSEDDIRVRNAYLLGNARMRWDQVNINMAKNLEKIKDVEDITWEFFLIQFKISNLPANKRRIIEMVVDLTCEIDPKFKEYMEGLRDGIEQLLGLKPLVTDINNKTETENGTESRKSNEPIDSTCE